MTIRWILVSNASEAVLYSTDSLARSLRFNKRFQHAESRAKNSELSSDTNGRKPGRGASAFSGSGAEAHTDPKEVEHQRFAHELADELNRGLLQHSYEGLVLCAPPHFLGLLRPNLSTDAARALEVTLNKDLTRLDERALSDVVHTTLKGEGRLG